MSSSTGEREVKIECLCGDQSYRYAVPTPKEPLSVFACHCNSCRHAGGALFHGAMFWKYRLLESRSGPPPVTYEVLADESQHSMTEHESSLVRYAFGKRLTYWFCGKCGSKIWWRYNKVSEDTEMPADEQDRPLELFPGRIPSDSWLISERHLKYTVQVFLEDTIDGGASEWIQGAQCWSGYTNMSQELKGPFTPRPNGHRVSQRVQANCHCQKIRYTWHVDGRDRRARVVLDTSDEMRRATSVEVSAWAHAKANDIAWDNFDDLASLSASNSVLKVSMQISHGVRELLRCRGCGACICYAADGNEVMLAIGLLDDRLGAKALSVLDWSHVQAVDLVGGGVVGSQNEGHH